MGSCSNQTGPSCPKRNTKGSCSNLYIIGQVQIDQNFVSICYLRFKKISFIQLGNIQEWELIGFGVTDFQCQLYDR